MRVRLGIPTLRSEQAGWTLVELLIVIALLAVVLTAILSLLDTSNKLSPQDQERGLAIREAQVGLHRMTVELRSAYALDSTQPYYLSAWVYTRGANKHVAFDCSGTAANPNYGQCIRTVLNGTAGQNAVLVKQLANKPGSPGSAVFSYTPRSDGKVTYIGVHADVPVRSSQTSRYTYTVPLNDGVYLRNLDG